jgi:hypothetical protein
MGLMPRTITKKSASTTPAAPTEEIVTAPAAVDAVAVQYDEQAGTATFELESGLTVVLKEPKAKDFIYLSSKLETVESWQRSPTMAAYILAHFMIESITGYEKLPSFDEFLDLLADDDLERVGAAFTCFPNIAGRMAKIFAAGNRTGAVV